MSTLLEICQAVCREGGIPGGEGALSDVAASSNSAEIKRIVGWAKSAWLEIQLKHQHSGLYWRWMRVGFTLTTVDGTSEYGWDNAALNDDETGSDITRFRKWMIKDYDDPPSIYLQSAGVGTEGFLTFLDWNDFKYLYRVGNQNDQQPVHISITPQNKLVLGPAPNGIYIASGDYLRGNQSLAANADTPDMPADFHDLIMWKALLTYALDKPAPELATRAEYMVDMYMGMLEADQLSEIPTAGPMA